MLFRLSINKLESLGFAKWYIKFSHVAATDKGISYAFENKLIS